MALLAAGCAINPVSGRPELVLTSTAGEVARGREAAGKVRESIGLADDPERLRWVEAIGARLAQHSPRQDVEYHFHVVDMVEPNAFALPGGWVYVSRGLLALVNSEDELANVIGHEIGHVAARHHVRSEVRQVPFIPLHIVTGVGALATSMVSPVLGELIGGIGSLPAAITLASYSRAQEREADEVGQKLAARSGWDPRGMATFMDTLARETKLQGRDPQRSSFFDSHPSSPERSATAEKRAAALERAPANPIAGTRAALLQRLDGLLVGLSGSEGAFVDNRFLHADLDFTVLFPAGWETHNARRVVAAVAPDKKAVVALQFVGEDLDEAVARAKVRYERPPAATKIAGSEARRALGRSGDTVLDLTWIQHGGGVYLIVGAVAEPSFERHRAALHVVGGSFRSLRGPEREQVYEMRLRHAEARGAESLEQLVQRSGSRWGPEETAVANSLDAGHALERGALIKVAVPEVYRPGP